MPAIRHSSVSLKTSVHQKFQVDDLSDDHEYTPLSGDESLASLNTDHDGARIPRPPNAFLIFRSQFWAKEKTKPANIERSHREISKMAGAAWRALSKEEQRPYHKEAQDVKDEHRRKYPNYVYNPRRTAEAASKRQAIPKRTTKVKITLSTPEVLQLESSPSPSTSAITEVTEEYCSAPSSSPEGSFDGSASSSVDPTPSPQTPSLSDYEMDATPHFDGWYTEEEIPFLELDGGATQGLSPKPYIGLKPSTISDMLFSHSSPLQVYEGDLFYHGLTPLTILQGEGIFNAEDFEHSLFDFSAFPE